MGLTLSPNGTGFTNGGTIQATGAGSLTLSGGPFNNFQGSKKGTIKTVGTGLIQLNNSTINGGNLTNSSTGTIESLGSTNNTIGGTVTNPAGGQIKIDNASVLNLKSGGTYNNSGTIALNATVNATELRITGPVTLSGTGKVILSNNSNNFIVGASTGTEVLTNMNTIQGSGNIGNSFMGLVNKGTILANQTTMLIIQPSAAGFNNQGTLSVSTGDTMKITGPANSFTNLSGTTLTGGTYLVSGTLQIDNANIVTNAANITLTGATSQIIDQTSANALANFATNAASGSFALAGGRNFTTAGNFTNNGTLTVGAGSKFDVNGNLSNFSGSTLTGGAYAVTGTLQFNGANIVSNAANITLTGATSQIIDQASANALANLADNAAAGVFSLQGGRTLTTAGSFSNEGMMTIGKSSKLTTAGAGNYTQTGGTTSVSGTLEIAGTSSAIAGTLANLSGGTVQVDKGVVTVQTSTSAFNNKGTLVVKGGATLDITGTNPFVNFASNTLTGGSYMVTGTCSLTTPTS